MKKKLIAILMATAMVATIFAGCSKSDSDKASSGEDTEYSVAMITDSGDITDVISPFSFLILLIWFLSLCFFFFFSPLFLDESG